MEKSYYVFTGSKGGRKTFPVGTVDQVKKLLTRSGFKVVEHIKEADAVIVPDGASSDSVLPTYGWNEFMTRMKRRKRASSRKASASKASSNTSRKPNLKTRSSNKASLPKSQTISNPNLEVPSTFKPFDFDALRAKLQAISHSQEFEPSRDSEPSQHFETLAAIPPQSNNQNVLQPPKYIVQNIDPTFPIICMQKLTNPSVYEYFLQNVEHVPFVNDMYEGLLVFYQQLNALFDVIFAFWSELRSNAEMVTDVGPLESFPTDCEAHHRFAWRHFADLFSVLQMTEVATVPFNPDNVAYFQQVEHDLRWMHFTLECANKRLVQEFEQWAHDYRARFRKCDTLDEHDCTHCCVRNGNTCQDKPLLLVFDDLIKSHCFGPESSGTNIIYIQDTLQGIYLELFGKLAEDRPSPCEQIAYMFNTIKATLDAMIGTSIRWSQATDFLNVDPQTWENLWSGTNDEKMSALLTISQLQEQPGFVEAVKALALALASIS